MPVTGVIEEEMMLQLVASMQQLHDEYFYTRIRLEINSPGGEARALDYCVEAMDSLRARGVRFTTRALMSAGSAAANLVALGDVREASRSASFLFHQARASTESVTAHAARQILTAVDNIDECYLTRLVRRGRAGEARRTAQKVGDFAAEDWPIIEYLLVSAGLLPAGTGRAKPARGSLLLGLRKHVTDCLRADDERPLKALYRRLFELDRYISAPLALELRLIDVLCDVNARTRRQRPPDHLHIPEWAPLFPPAGRVSRTELCRHTLILGETGSGKTRSGILPIVGGIMAPASRVGCALIIDPKGEIRPHLDTLAHDGVTVRDLDVHGGPPRAALNVMAGDGLSVAPDLEQGRYLEAARKILVRSASLAPSSAATILAGIESDPRARYWDNEGARLAMTALGLVLLLLDNRQRIFGRLDRRLIDAAAPSTADALLNFAGLAGLAGMTTDWARSEEARACIELTAGDLSCIKKPDWECKLNTEYNRHERLLGETPGSYDSMRREYKLAADTEYREALSGIIKRFLEMIQGTELYRSSAAFRVQLAQQKLDDPESAALLSPGTLQARLRKLIPAKWQLFADKDIRPGPNVLALAGAVMQSWFNYEGKSKSDDMAVTAVVKLLKTAIHHGQANDIYRQIEESWVPMASRNDPGQYIGIIGHARTCFWDFADETPARTLYFGVEPYYLSALEHGREDLAPVDFGAIVDDETARTVFVCRPGLNGDETLVAKALKAAFFEAILSSRKRQKDGAAMPLAAYVADEFHRFITSDTAHGEQSFLDTCRSFGVSCALACQSIASMEHALAGMTKNEPLNRNAVSILLANTANKLFFRSTDRALHECVDQLCPGAGPLGKPTHVRPLSTLQPGECYASLTDGRFVRRQLLPFGAGHDETADDGTMMRMRA